MLIYERKSSGSFVEKIPSFISWCSLWFCWHVSWLKWDSLLVTLWRAGLRTTYQKSREAPRMKVKRSTWCYWEAEYPALELPSLWISSMSFEHSCNISQLKLGVPMVGSQCYINWFILHLCLKVSADTVMALKQCWMNVREVGRVGAK